MHPLQIYLGELHNIRSIGAAVKETSYYPPLANLLNTVGQTIKPRVRCVINLKNQGAGMPDGGLFTPDQLQKEVIMSSVNYDPDKVPEIDHRLIDKARKYNMQIAHVICDEKGAKVGDTEGVSFVALVPAVPRIGERLHLQNKTKCIVRQIDWSVVTDPDGLLRLFPSVYAERVKEREDLE